MRAEEAIKKASRLLHSGNLLVRLSATCSLFRTILLCYWTNPLVPVWRKLLFSYPVLAGGQNQITATAASVTALPTTPQPGSVGMCTPRKHFGVEYMDSGPIGVWCSIFSKVAENKTPGLRYKKRGKETYKSECMRCDRLFPSLVVYLQFLLPLQVQ